MEYSPILAVATAGFEIIVAGCAFTSSRAERLASRRDPTHRRMITHDRAIAMLAVSAGIVAWIVLDPSFAAASVCNAVYARYARAQPRFQLYAAYYWAGLLAMIALSGYGTLTSTDPHRRHLHAHVQVGTVGFVLPSIAVSYFVPAARNTLPSVMCHFALILAVLLARMLWVMRAESMATRSALTRSTP